MVDLGNIAGLNGTKGVTLKHGTTEDKTTLDFNDYLMLMVTQLKNQTIDNTTDTSEMMNQMVQMSVMQAITDISTLIKESSSLNYAASLVGKTVTVGVREGDSVREIEGVVTATGTYGGEQVIFMGDKCYYLNSVMAVGSLPEGEIKPNGGTSGTGATDTDETTEATGTTGGAEKSETGEREAQETAAQAAQAEAENG